MPYAMPQDEFQIHQRHKCKSKTIQVLGLIFYKLRVEETFLFMIQTLDAKNENSNLMCVFQHHQVIHQSSAGTDWVCYKFNSFITLFT